MSEHLRGERDDLHEVALAQLARHRAEDARAARIVLGVDQDGGVLVEGDVGAVVAPELLLRPHDDRLDDLALLDRSVGNRLLDGADDHVADAGVAAVRAPGDPDAQHLARAGVVGDLQPGLLLDHGLGPIYRALSRISTRRHRFVRLSGRLSITRTVSPVWASFRSSCAWRVELVRTIFLYIRCGLAMSIRTVIVLSARSETTTPWRTFRAPVARGSGAGTSPRGRSRRRSRSFCR